MKPAVTIVGGGMITHDQLLPSLYQMQRNGAAGDITVCALDDAPLRALRESEILRRAFPRSAFTASTESYADVIARMPAGNVVVVAVPDQVHYQVVMAALRANQHVVCVKPLVLHAAQAVEIEREAGARGLFVGVEYHKRFDDRSLMARRRYREGLFGDFRLGNAWLMEKWYYRHSNFQNWMTAENSDSFTYIGCHYVDLVHFITGLLPVSISLYGLRDRFPNGKEGFLFTDARVTWSNGACLNVQNSLSVPDEAPGTNTQGMKLYCSKGDAGGMLHHSDQYRGIEYCYLDRPSAPGATTYTEPSADYFQYVDLGGGTLTPVGYGLRSVEHLVRAAVRVQEAGDLAARQAVLREIDSDGVLATPANSRYNELVTEAGRLSIMNDAREVFIDYQANEVSFR